MKSAAATTTDTQACRTDKAPVGSSRFRVRGFSESKWRSAIRLNPIATQRAAENATTTRRMVRHSTGCRNDAARTPSNAKGNAKSVCGNLTKLT